jgi:hypothetical protein
MSTQKWLRVKEVARILNQSLSSVMNHFAPLVGKEPGVIDLGHGKKRELRVSRRFLDRWMFTDHREKFRK